MWYELCIVFWRRETKKKKKLEKKLFFQCPSLVWVSCSIFFSFSLVHWIFCSALWNHKLVLIILPDCLLCFDSLSHQIQMKTKNYSGFKIYEKTRFELVQVMHVYVSAETLKPLDRTRLSPPWDPCALRESRGGLGESGGGGEESSMLAWGPDQPPPSLNTIDCHSDISQHMPSILSVPSLTRPPTQQNEH